MIRSEWLLFVANLPGSHQTRRMRVWRNLKASGAAALRDGVYLLPRSDASRSLFERQCGEIRVGGGTAWVLDLAADPADPQDAALRALFDRTAGYAVLAARLAELRRRLAKLQEADVRRRLGVLGREAAALAATDFFPGEARRQLDAALVDAQAALAARFSRGEPGAAARGIERLDPDAYHGRLWATRAGLWIDRVCSAWLIRRFIDPKAKFLWLKRPRDCPARALGFDFDGAAFTHVGSRVTFEVLLASFGLEGDPTLARLGALVHYLDVGGIPVPEATGLAAIFAGARALARDDDAFVAQVGPMLDSLYSGYSVTGRD